MQLKPLTDVNITGLLATVLAHHGLLPVDPALLARVSSNPLFAEEYAYMLHDRAGIQFGVDLN